MHPDIYKFLEDVKKSIEIIEQHISETQSLVAYSNNLKTIDSVERRLAIIGEALFKANKIDNNLILTDKSKIIGLRHILVHEYDLIDDATIWFIIQKNLPVLKQEIQTILNHK